MKQSFDPAQNYQHTMKVVGYVTPQKAPRELYEKMGFKSGLEIHQQKYINN